MNEAYCREWVAIKSLQQLKKQMALGNNNTLLISQISVVEDGQQYFSLSLAKKLDTKKNTLESLTIGFLVNDDLKKFIHFLSDANIKHIFIAQTCERCPKEDCDSRAFPPVIYQKESEQKKKEKALFLLAQ
jgi:predicted transcriptional regulator